MHDALQHLPGFIEQIRRQIARHGGDYIAAIAPGQRYDLFRGRRNGG